MRAQPCVHDLIYKAEVQLGSEAPVAGDYLSTTHRKFGIVGFLDLSIPAGSGSVVPEEGTATETYHTPQSPAAG
jgi:hypothetical protein